MEDKLGIIIRVAIQRPLYKLLDYQCHSSLSLVAGVRVQVPLGNTKIIAIVVDIDVESEFTQLKSVIKVLDSEPLIDSTALALLKWASRYYFYPIGEVIFHALPVGLRKGKSLPKIKLWRANTLGISSVEEIKKAPKQHEMLQLLVKNECGEQVLREKMGKTWRNILKQLDKKSLIEEREIEVGYSAMAKSTIAKPATVKQDADTQPNKQAITLTEEQNHCITSIVDSFSHDVHKPILLYGITGSGKTEVYLQSIAPILAKGKQVLVLVPEIGLTPQLLSRFKEHFPQYNTVTLHSGLNDSERLLNWLGAKSGSVDIVIGTRSAIFTPMPSLGMILVDEEHDASFKQQEGFLYHGRDMAIKRAHDLTIPILLGSATPSLETLHNAQQERYVLLRLKNRPGARKRPEMLVQDIRALTLEAGISDLLVKEIRQHIENNQQVMLFLNRRGFAPVLMCPACGWHAVCRHCDIGMTYHATFNKVICHHCGVEERIGTTCPDCKSPQLTTQGQGTERIEQVLNTYFPNMSVIRVDRDSTSRKGVLEQKLDEVKSGKPVILIGTQMLTKGHDFPKLTLVGILDVDQALFSMDFRAHERLAQQIIQVAGRAGRGDDKGRVILQSCQPEHPLLVNLLTAGYYQIAKDILNERLLWNYPPYGAQALLRVSSNNADAGLTFLHKLKKALEDQIVNDVCLLGPIPSPLAKKANRYRFQLLFSAPARGQLHKTLEETLLLILSFRKNGGVRWSMDIDPIEFL